ncbi:MAG: putative transposase, partial [Planctomycetota bacterium]
VPPAPGSQDVPVVQTKDVPVAARQDGEEADAGLARTKEVGPASETVTVQARAVEQEEAAATREAVMEAVAEPVAIEHAEFVADGESAAGAEVHPAPVALQDVPAPQSAELPTGLPPRGTTVEQARQFEFLSARMGWIEEQSALFETARAVPFAGALMALAVLPATGLLETIRSEIGRLPNGFYGVRSLVTQLFTMALLRVKRPEQLKNYDPAALGRVVGIARAPEMKTMRRKVAWLALDEEKTGRVLLELARRHAERAKDALAFLYVDGHVRAYYGKRKLSKAHITQMRLSMPATTEYWVNDAAGEPVLVVTVQGNRAMTRTLLDVLAEVRKVIGPDATPTVVFDRGGWSPKLFRRIRQANFHFLTYRKGHAPVYPRSSFKPLEVRKGGELVERPVRDGNTRLRGYGRCRCVAILRDDGKQTHILTSRSAEELSTRETCERMSSRWQQENFFRYATGSFALDALWTYEIIAGDGNRLVPNPARKKLERQITAARAERKTLQAAVGGDFVDADEVMDADTLIGRRASDIVRITELDRQLAQWSAERRALPTHVTVSTIRNPADIVELARAPKLLLDAVKICAYHAETILVSHLAPHLNRAEDEARNTVAAAMHLPGDFEVRDGELHVTLAPGSAPRYTHAVAGLAASLDALGLCFPETSLRLRFHVAPHPGEEGESA